MQLAILCGGLGTRLGKLSEKTPKILMDINGTPFIELLLAEYRKAGFTKFVLLAGHLGSKLKKYKSKDVLLIKEKETLGTGGAIINALDKLEDHFFVANGDTFIDAKSIHDFAIHNKGKDASLIFHTHAGLFAFNKETLKKFGNVSLMIEKDLLLDIKNFHYYVIHGKFHDIGTPERLEEFRRLMK
jgi:NDP-sugar pyrophosphorylase family protein